MRQWDSISEHDRSWAGLTEENFLADQESNRQRLEAAAAKMSRVQFFEWFEQNGFDLLERSGDLKVEWIDD